MSREVEVRVNLSWSAWGDAVIHHGSDLSPREAHEVARRTKGFTVTETIRHRSGNVSSYGRVAVEEHA